MKRARKNPKHRLLSREAADSRRKELDDLGRCVQYGGNPEHKRNPGDFNLTPSHAAGRPGKTLCDDAGVIRRSEALRLLREAFARGAVSDRFDGAWPRSVWAVAESNQVVRATMERTGVYHGYPVDADDPIIESVQLRWTGGDRVTT